MTMPNVMPKAKSIPLSGFRQQGVRHMCPAPPTGHDEPKMPRADKVKC